MNELERRLASTGSAGPALNRLRETVARRAEQQGLLDVAYRTLDTAVGQLLLAATPAGLVRVGYPRQGHDQVLAELSARISPRILHAPARLDAVAVQLEEYLAARRHSFDLPLDLRLAHGFRRLVLDRLPTIAYGHTTSYAGLAADLGNPRAVRAVGSACATNPLPLVIPCHRVVRSDGTPGEYAGGAEVKQRLLQLESPR